MGVPNHVFIPLASAAPRRSGRVCRRRIITCIFLFPSARKLGRALLVFTCPVCVCIFFQHSYLAYRFLFFFLDCSIFFRLAVSANLLSQQRVLNRKNKNKCKAKALSLRRICALLSSFPVRRRESLWDGACKSYVESTKYW